MNTQANTPATMVPTTLWQESMEGGAHSAARDKTAATAMHKDGEIGGQGVTARKEGNAPEQSCNSVQAVTTLENEVAASLSGRATPGNSPHAAGRARALIGAHLIAYRINRQPQQRARLLGMIELASTLGALDAADHATAAASLEVCHA